MNKLVLSLSLALFAIAGCSDENSKVRGEFLAGCVQGGAPKSVCKCTFEKLEDQYSPAELKSLSKTLNPPPEFMRSVMESALACRDE